MPSLTASPVSFWGKPNLHGFAKHNRPSGKGFEWRGYTTLELNGDLRLVKQLVPPMSAGVQSLC